MRQKEIGIESLIPPMSTRRYSAFISYRHADNTQEGRRWAEWLHRGLERYVVPPDLIGTPNLRKEPIRDSLYPIFRDEDELPANADLATGIRAALEVSDYLIVLCSPRSAVSPWVRKEVREFKELGRSDRILAIILAGEPNADDPAKARDGIMRDEECFCEELRYGAMREDGTIDWTIRTEPLAADLRPVGTRAEGFVTAEAYREYLNFNSSFTKEKITTLTEAYRQRLDQSVLKVIAGLLGVPLGQLVDRDAAHRADLAKKELERSQAEAARLRTFSHRLAVAGAAALLLALLAGVFWWRAGKERTAAVNAQAHAEKAEADAVKAQAEERNQREKAEATTMKLRESDTKQEALLLTASYGDHEAAVRAFEELRPNEGLAYLERALSYAPTNRAALVASASYAFGSSAPNLRTRSISAFESEVLCVVFSPNGRYLAAGCKKGDARVIETATGKEVSRTNFGGRVTSLSFSPDAHYLAACSGDLEGNTNGEARVIEASTGKEVSRTKFDESVTSVNFSPNGRHFAAGCADKTARVIEAASGKVVCKAEFGGVVRSVCFSPDGHYLAASCDDDEKFVRVIDATTGKEIAKAECSGEVNSLNFSPNGHYFAVGCQRLFGGVAFAQVFEAVTGKEVNSTEFGGTVNSVTFSPDGCCIAAGSDDGSVRVIETATGKEISKANFAGGVNSVSFSSDGRLLAVGIENENLTVGEVCVIESATGSEVNKVLFEGRVTSVNFSLDGLYLAAGSADKTARVFEAVTGKQIRNVEVRDENHHEVRSVDFSRDGRYLALGSTSFRARGEAQVIEVTSGNVVSRIVFDDGVTSVSLGADGRYLAAGIDDNTARVIEVVTGKELSKAELGRSVNSVSFSPECRYLAVGSEDHTARMIEAATGKEVCKVGFHDGVTSVCFSPDGRYFAAGSKDHTARMIEASTGKEVYKVVLDDGVNSVSFSPNGRYLAASSDDHTVWVIEATSGREVSKIQFSGGVTSVNFSSDSLYMALGISRSSFGGNEARVIEVATGKEVNKSMFIGRVTSVRFSPDGRYLAVGSSEGAAVRVLDWTWGKSDFEMAKIWPAALGVQSGLRFLPTGKLEPIPAHELAASFAELKTYIAAEPLARDRWTYAILKWWQMMPEQRTTSPWTTEPLWAASGHVFMHSFWYGAITESADEAPWHPLEPVSLARLEKKQGMKDYDPVQRAIRTTFLARLTLKRLRDADEKLYGRDTLAEYASWAAKIMHEELKLKPEALEALAFALERTPPEKRQDLLKLKAEIEEK